ncbi:MAG: thymidine kinase [Candidatus Sumerlaeota bacterium]|nr:thymidine kinase [Candidatus Sumerlaeota bacterium]
MNIVKHPNRGWIEVICGPMFSGKSEELIRRLRRARIARQDVLAFKPRLDNRYSENAIASHNQQIIPCVLIDTADEIFVHLRPQTQVVGIDEVQFLGAAAPRICREMAARGVRIICAGLDTDYRARPWPPVPEFLADAEYITKTLAICVVCGDPANRTQRKVHSGELVLIGSADSYEARCRHCHTVDGVIQPSMFGDEAGGNP